MRVYILILFFPILGFTQTNLQSDISSKVSGQPSNYGSSFFYNPPNKVILGSYYLFDEWNNNGIIETISGDRFLVKKINLNMSRNAFEAKGENDSIFSFNFNNIDKVIVNDKVFKNYYYNEDNRVYQVVYENDSFSILKGFSVKLISRSGNPMINRENDRYVRKKKYFLRNKKGKTIKYFKLNRRSINKLFTNINKSQIEVDNFISENELSFKDDEDVSKLLNYIFER